MCCFMAASSGRRSGLAAGPAGRGTALGVAAPPGAIATPRAVATSRHFPLPRIAARSITAASSRMLPGQA